MKLISEHINSSKFNLYDELIKCGACDSEDDLFYAVMVYYHDNKRKLEADKSIPKFDNDDLSYFSDLADLNFGMCVVFANFCIQYLPIMEIKYIWEDDDSFHLFGYDEWVINAKMHRGGREVTHAILEYNGLYYDSVTPLGTGDLSKFV